jgi:hypothetical protein
MNLTSLKCYAFSDLSYNNLVGSFPSWISETNLQLYVYYCLLHSVYYIRMLSIFSIYFSNIYFLLLPNNIFNQQSYKILNFEYGLAYSAFTNDETDIWIIWVNYAAI